MNNIKKVGYLMMILGALSVSSVLISLALGVFMTMINQFLPVSLYTFFTAFIVTFQTYLLNHYFEKRLKDEKLKDL